jgi:hypothetical protein
LLYYTVADELCCQTYGRLLSAGSDLKPLEDGVADLVAELPARQGRAGGDERALV